MKSHLLQFLTYFLIHLLQMFLFYATTNQNKTKTEATLPYFSSLFFNNNTHFRFMLIVFHAINDILHVTALFFSFSSFIFGDILFEVVKSSASFYDRIIAWFLLFLVHLHRLSLINEYKCVFFSCFFCVLRL